MHCVILENREKGDGWGKAIRKRCPTQLSVTRWNVMERRQGLPKISFTFNHPRKLTLLGKARPGQGHF